jgi:hypothetical protein
MRAGDKVELRPPGEILASLDQYGTLDGLPFMPEMLSFFGRQFTVDARVERACDTIDYTGPRRLRDTVLLDDLRCGGSAHAGCQARCRLYWKEAWLRPASPQEEGTDATATAAFGELERLVSRNVHGASTTPDKPTFRCQATELLRASEPVGWWNVRSFVNELTSGNVGPWRWVRMMVHIVVGEIGRRLGLLSNLPFSAAELKGQKSTPPPGNELHPGQLVQIRSKDAIRQTLGQEGKNRGLWFDREMLTYCGHTARVKGKVERFIDERTGSVVEMATDAYILDDVICRSDESDGRWFCPRAIYPWWRECWLEPVDDEPAVSSATPAEEARAS